MGYRVGQHKFTGFAQKDADKIGVFCSSEIGSDAVSGTHLRGIEPLEMAF